LIQDDVVEDRDAGCLHVGDHLLRRLDLLAVPECAACPAEADVDLSVDAMMSCYRGGTGMLAGINPG
jgi:hypothetical protein